MALISNNLIFLLSLLFGGAESQTTFAYYATTTIAPPTTTVYPTTYINPQTTNFKIFTTDYIGTTTAKSFLQSSFGTPLVASSFGPTTYYPLATTLVGFAGTTSLSTTPAQLLLSTDQNFQIIYNNVDASNSYPPNSTAFLASQLKSISGLQNLDTNRFVNFFILTVPNATSRAVLRFKILGNTTVLPSATYVASALSNSLNSGSAANSKPWLAFPNGQVLNSSAGNCYWSEYGPCPAASCDGGKRCFADTGCVLFCSVNDTSLSGTFPVAIQSNDSRRLTIQAWWNGLILFSVVHRMLLVRE